MSAPRRPGVPNAQPSTPVVEAAQPVAAEGRTGPIALKLTGVSFEQTAAGLGNVGAKIFAVETDPVAEIQAKLTGYLHEVLDEISALPADRRQDGVTAMIEGLRAGLGPAFTSIRGLASADMAVDFIRSAAEAEKAAKAADMADREALLEQAGGDPFLAAAIEEGRATPSTELESRVADLKAKRGGK